MDVAEVVALGVGAQDIELLAGEPERPATELDGQGQITTDRQAQRRQSLDWRMHDHACTALEDAASAGQPQRVAVLDECGADLQDTPACRLQAIAPGHRRSARHRRYTEASVVRAADLLGDAHGRGRQAGPVLHLQSHVQRLGDGHHRRRDPPPDGQPGRMDEAHGQGHHHRDGSRGPDDVELQDPEDPPACNRSDPYR